MCDPASYVRSNLAVRRAASVSDRLTEPVTLYQKEPVSFGAPVAILFAEYRTSIFSALRLVIIRIPAVRLKYTGIWVQVRTVNKICHVLYNIIVAPRVECSGAQYGQRRLPGSAEHDVSLPFPGSQPSRCARARHHSRLGASYSNA